MADEKSSVVIDKEVQPAVQATPSAESKTYAFGGKTYGSVDELGKAYESAQGELGKWTQQYGDIEKKYKEAEKHVERATKWDEWWKTIQPLWGEDVENFLRQKLPGATRQQSAAPATATP